MNRDYRPRIDLDETLVSKVRELYPDLIIHKLVNDLLFHYILITMEDRIPDALHPGLLRKAIQHQQQYQNNNTEEEGC